MSNPTGKGGFRDHPERVRLHFETHPEKRYRFTSADAKRAGQIANDRSRARARERALTAARIAVRDSERDLGAVLHALYASAYERGYHAGLRWKKRQPSA